jgi:hypothetical protein
MLCTQARYLLGTRQGEQLDTSDQVAPAAGVLTHPLCPFLVPSTPGEGERVSLGRCAVKVRGGVESWLGQVESAMVASLRRLAKAGMGSYAEEARPQWVQQPHNPSQLVIAISQVQGPGCVEGPERGPCVAAICYAVLPLHCLRVVEEEKASNPDCWGKRVCESGITCELGLTILPEATPLQNP